ALELLPRVAESAGTKCPSRGLRLLERRMGPDAQGARRRGRDSLGRFHPARRARNALRGVGVHRHDGVSLGRFRAARDPGRFVFQRVAGRSARSARRKRNPRLHRKLSHGRAGVAAHRAPLREGALARARRPALSRVERRRDDRHDAKRSRHERTRVPIGRAAFVPLEDARGRRRSRRLRSQFPRRGRRLSVAARSGHPTSLAKQERRGLPMKSVVDDCLLQLGRALEIYPWHDKIAYGDWLAQTYWYVRHSTRLLATASGRMPLDAVGDAMHLRYAKHIGEEQKHEKLCIHDLSALGLSLEALPQRTSTKMFWEPQYYKVEHEHPSVLMGYILALEALACVKGP